jgi:hypothetical protein
LLIVISIIAILMALSVSAAFRMLGVQERVNTTSTIQKVDSALEEQWKKVIAQGDKNSHSAAAIDPTGYALIQTIAGDSGNDIENGKRFDAIYRGYYLKQQFPQSFAEVLLCTQNPQTANPSLFNPLGPSEDYVRKLKNLDVKPNAGPNGSPLPGESSALLLMALEKATGGPGKLADTFGANCIKKQSFPTNGGGQVDVDVLKDDWGTPIQFYRWTTNADVDALAPASKSVIRNPLDIEGKLHDGTWYKGGYRTPVSTAPRILFEKSCYSVTRGNALHAYYYVPVIVSAGPNKQLGLDLQTMTVTGSANDIADNIYSYQVKKE